MNARPIMTIRRLSWTKVAIAASLISAGILLWACAGSDSKPSVQASTQPSTQPTQITFKSPEEAVHAVVDALRANDTPRLQAILGPGADQVLSSGDDVADQQNKQKFLDLYDAKSQIVIGADGSATLNVGPDDWPMPIPIVNDGGAWHFDTPGGLDEMLNRRIGKNELATIQVCEAIVDAQEDYVNENPTGSSVPEYAQKFQSDPGKKNGLYWPTDASETPSPLGPLVVAAADQGYSLGVPPGTPYHGYMYRMLKAQGPNAPGGEMDYVVDGKMIGGFAAIAFPAQYGNSGIMTFIVNYQGTVYQKDLGDDTESIAKAITTYDPDDTWKPAE